MTKEITYKLDYKEDGKPLSKNIRINFISNGMRKDYFAIEKDIDEGGRLNILYKTKMIEYDALKRTKQDTSDIEKDFEDIKTKLEVILDDGANSFVKRRISLIQKILIGNGFAKTDKFVSAEFWDDCVDIETINHFIKSSINKDIEDIKKK